MRTTPKSFAETHGPDGVGDVWPFYISRKTDNITASCSVSHEHHLLRRQPKDLAGLHQGIDLSEGATNWETMHGANLDFFQEVDGRKPHYIFTQDETFYVMTSLDDDKRGNFFAIHNTEVNRVRNQIVTQDLRDFHPKDIGLYRYIRNEEHRQHRLRCICYVLVAQRLLYISKRGRELHFCPCNELLKEMPIKHVFVHKPAPETGLPTEYDYYDAKRKTFQTTAGNPASNKKKQNQKRKNKPTDVLTSHRNDRIYVDCPVCGDSIRETRLAKHRPKCKGSRR